MLTSHIGTTPGRFIMRIYKYSANTKSILNVFECASRFIVKANNKRVAVVVPRKLRREAT